ncbi:Wzz/FepE/Etk N-terminal domain-containing protein [Yersinia intermedia]|uniref:Wzz/FepE/Etk N-terminal domain-containing protein n=1 Tax=Yersinia intermedia TaxID=631 RepID=UPI00223EBFF8|nr:Wzz/FepE/Etk N-terminal domain-containing protein [Yersinia intermedia]UZM70105.1 Wzz/FepE/Etk N-terminal domain-containing protein [Yersinia intermedia]
MSDNSAGNEKILSTFKPEGLASNKDEIDLVVVASIVSKSYKLIMSVTLVFIVIGACIALLTPKNWTSSAVISPASDSQLQPLEAVARPLSLLNISLDISSGDIVTEFKKYYSSPNVLVEYLLNTKNDHSGSMGVTSLVADQNAQNFTDNRNNYILTYSSNADSGMKDILAGYIDYVNKKVVFDINRQINFTIDTAKTTATEEYQLVLQQAQNEQKVRIQRLEYAASIAKAAGLQKPANDAFSISVDNGNYPISLGYDALNRQLEIEKSITDLTTVNTELLNKKLLLDKIMGLKPVTVDIPTFNYLQHPSDPIEQGAKKRLLVVLLFGFIGLFGSIGFVLVRHYVRERQNALLNLPKK